MQQQDDNDDAKVLVEEWEKLLDDTEQIKKIDLETFKKQWLQHPKLESFINWKDNSIANGKTMLLCALGCNRLDIAKLLVENDSVIDTHIANKDGNTALMLACYNGHEKFVHDMLEKKGDYAASHLDTANNKGMTALMGACTNGHTDIGALLLQKGANVNSQDKYGNSALIWASFGGHTDTVKLLLDQGANIECADKDGKTALMRAAIEGHKDTVKLLLDRGAHMSAADNEGKTALWYGNNNKDICEIFASEMTIGRAWRELAYNYWTTKKG